MKKLFIILLFSMISAVFAEVVQLGKIDDYTIVLPSKPTKQERYSAALLAEYLEKLYKLPVPVKFDRNKIRGKYISVGETKYAKENNFTEKLANQSYSFKVKDGNLFIRGGFPGPLNGVITYLQDDLGCRWYARSYSNIPKCKEPGLTIIPELKGKNLTVTARDYTPPFQIREVMYRYGYQSAREEELFFRLAPISYHSDLPEDAGASLNSKLFIHTYTALVNPKKYYAKHPEYFALQNGKRVRQHSEYGSVCYTNPDVPHVMLERIREEIKNNPEAMYFSVSANDGTSTQCECTNCAPLFQKYNNSDVQMMLANKVTDLLVKEKPDALVTTLVYAAEKTQIQPHKNIALFFAPINARYNAIKMLVALNEHKDIDEALKSFINADKKVIFWDYLEAIGKFHPYPNFDQMRDSLRYLRDNKVMGYFADCNTGGASLMHLKKWVYSQLLWNPDADMDALIAEFINAYYGKCAPEMTEYVALIRQAWQKFIKQYRKDNFTMLEYSAVERSKMHSIFEKAMEKSSSDEVLKGRIAREYWCFLCMELDGNAEVYGIEKYRKYYEIMKSIINYLPTNASIRDNFLKRCEDKINFANRERHSSEYSKNSVTVWKPLVVNGLSAYLDDAKAVKGKSSRHIGKKPWGIQWKYFTFIDYLVPGKTYVVRLRVRPEVKKVIPGKTMFSFSAFHHGGGFKNQPIFHGKFTEDDKKGDYRWINLGKLEFVSPSSLGMFWMDSTVNPDEAVWYERLEFIPLEEFKEDISTVPNQTMKL